MKAIVLAAGYATRLYPLTEDRPKPLLEVAGKTIMDYIMEKLEKVESLSEVFIVTNDKFFQHFSKWKQDSNYSKLITIYNDGTTTNENRLGAIGDIQFVVEQAKIDDDLLIIAGDNLFDFELNDFANFFENVNFDCITTYRETNPSILRRAGVIEVDNNSKVLSFEEKPENPKSNYAVPAFYLYQSATLPLLKKYLNEGNNPDAPGHFIPFLLRHKDVYAYKFEGRRYDIGTIESYEEVQKIFKDRLSQNY